ncbi:MAG: prephenate dehydratase domain-containing protein, partial [Candidatus Pacebacteria bacterium]|nr:prephenate dehydratase domain-containing protein [Candidatus Paceibacterota bacterium]
MSKNLRIGYLGPEGSFSEQAALKFCKEENLEANLVPLSSYALADALKNKRAEKIIVPVENSIEGFVNLTFDILNGGSNFLIEKEIVLKIEQNLLGLGKISTIKSVYSHPEGLAQCRKFLDK